MPEGLENRLGEVEWEQGRPEVGLEEPARAVVVTAIGGGRGGAAPVGGAPEAPK